MGRHGPLFGNWRVWPSPTNAGRACDGPLAGALAGGIFDCAGPHLRCSRHSYPHPLVLKTRREVVVAVVGTVQNAGDLVLLLDATSKKRADQSPRAS